jgi:murein DD-endopeptidase MepM/ murein hydrolase activator NlpD
VEKQKPLLWMTAARIFTAFVGEDAKNYGNIVILRHADGTMTSYSHASRIAVKKGDRVDAGTTIAYVGQTGNARTPQLHFAVREGKNSVDPMTKLPHQVASN